MPMADCVSDNVSRLASRIRRRCNLGHMRFYLYLDIRLRLYLEICGHLLSFCAAVHHEVQKALMKFKCNICGVTTTQMRRHFGVWPTTGFSLLSPDR